MVNLALSPEIQAKVQSLGNNLDMYNSVQEATAKIQSAAVESDIIAGFNADAIRLGQGFDIGNTEALGSFRGAAEGVANSLGGTLESTAGAEPFLDKAFNTVRELTPDIDTSLTAAKATVTGGIDDLGFGAASAGMGAMGSGGSGRDLLSAGNLYDKSADTLKDALGEAQKIISTLVEKGADYIEDGKDGAMAMFASIGEHRSQSAALAA